MAGKKIYITTRSADETRVLGKKIGTLINQPVIISLIGDLASGKTAFVQGLAQGLHLHVIDWKTPPLLPPLPLRLRAQEGERRVERGGHI